MLRFLNLPIPGLKPFLYARFEEPSDGGSGAGVGGQPNKDDSSKMIPYERFTEVNNALKAYKELGTPEEIKTMAQEYNEVLDLVLSQEEKGGPGKKSPTPKLSDVSDTQRAKMLAQLEELVPGITEFASVKEKAEKANSRAEQLSESQLNGLLEKASKEVRVMASEYPDDAQETIEDLVANKIFGNPKSKSAFLKGDTSVLTEAFKAVESEFLGKHVQKKPRTKLPGIFSNKGLSSTGTEDHGPLSEEKLKGMSAAERKRAIGKDAFDFYLQQVAANQD